MDNKIETLLGKNQIVGPSDETIDFGTKALFERYEQLLELSREFSNLYLQDISGKQLRDGLKQIYEKMRNEANLNLGLLDRLKSSNYVGQRIIAVAFIDKVVAQYETLEDSPLKGVQEHLQWLVDSLETRNRFLFDQIICTIKAIGKKHQASTNQIQKVIKQFGE